jgi:riboflavin synthase
VELPLFTGLIQLLGRVEHAIEPGADSGRLVVAAAGVPAERSELGASIAINGCCLTVSDRLDGGRFAFDVMGTTVEHTNIGSLEAGSPVNVECALRMGDPLGGHWLQGHVDDIGAIASVEEGDGQLDVWIDVPEEIHRLCVERGSIGVDGVSLTVMGLRPGAALVSLIPETRERTTLGHLTAGSKVNLEADILAKYVARLMPANLASSAAPSR